MTEPTSDLAAAVARVEAYLDTSQNACPWPLDGDLHALLAALHAAQEDGARLDWLESRTRKREGVVLGWEGADRDFDEWNGMMRERSETFYVDDEAQMGLPFSTIRAAIDAACAGEAK